MEKKTYYIILIIFLIIIFILCVLILIFVLISWENNNNNNKIKDEDVLFGYIPTDFVQEDLKKKFNSRTGLIFSDIALAAYYASVTNSNSNQKFNFVLEKSFWINPNNFELNKLTDILQFEQINTYIIGFCARFNEDIIIGFGGTNFTSFNNIVTDLDIKLVEFPSFSDNKEVKVAKGFKEAWDSIKDVTILPYLKGKVTDKTNIWISGHSLGGSLTTLCACDLSVIYGADKIIQYTYASPKVGNSQFVTEMNLKGVSKYNNRVRNIEDIVPTYPFDFEGYNFSQPWEIIFEKKKNNFSKPCIINPSPELDWKTNILIIPNHELFTYQVIINEQPNCSIIT